MNTLETELPIYPIIFETARSWTGGTCLKLSPVPSGGSLKISPAIAWTWYIHWQLLFRVTSVVLSITFFSIIRLEESNKIILLQRYLRDSNVTLPVTHAGYTMSYDNDVVAKDLNVCVRLFHVIWRIVTEFLGTLINASVY